MAAGCSDPTAIVLHITSEADILASDLDQLRVSVQVGGIEVGTLESPLTNFEGTVDESLTLYPGSTGDEEVFIEVTGMQSWAAIVRGSVTTAFQKSKVVDATVILDWINEVCLDNDGDGYGRGAGCLGELDCDDSDRNVYPGALESCNQVDDDCDGLTDEDLPDCACIDDAQCSDIDDCTDDRCVSGECQHTPVTDGTFCDDGLYCTVSDSCQGGVCQGDQRDCSVPDDVCHTWTCDQVQDACVSYPANDLFPCDDGDPCTDGDYCWNGDCASGQALDCSHLDAECILGVCNPVSGVCEQRSQSDGESCEDGDLCTEGETCSSGSCLGGMPKDCGSATDQCNLGVCEAETGNCIGQPDNEGESCDDGFYCTELDTCTLGVCGGLPMDCSHLDDQCIDGVCDEVGMQCQAQPVIDGAACDDTDACTINDSCQAGVCGGEPKDTDGDGYIDQACGGADCDDSAVSINPEGLEGLPGEAPCSDGADNDCDGMIDSWDSGCWPPICNPAGWCWQNPRPQGLGLRDTWRASPDDIWAVGEQGTILHWNGVGWSLQDGQTERDLNGLWGFSDTDVWAVGYNTIIHKDALGWTDEANYTGGHLYAVWGASTSDVWAVGLSNNCEHFEGAGWTSCNPGTWENWFDIWGNAADDFWVVGDDGLAMHYTGSWQQTTADASGRRLEAVWGSGPADVWALGPAGLAAHYTAGWAATGSNVSGVIYGLWGVDNGSIWGVGANGIYAYWNGALWTGGDTGQSRTLRDLFGSSGTDILAVGDLGTMVKFDGTNWQQVDYGSRGLIRAVWGASESDAWAVGDDGLVLHGNGHFWTEVDGVTNRDLYDVWGFSAQDVWAVGQSGTILHYDGSEWSESPNSVSQILYGVWGYAADDVWAVGNNGTILRWQGVDWVEYPVIGFYETLRAVWGGSASAIWAVGGSGSTLLWDGSTWEVRTYPTSSTLYAIWGSGTTDIWAVGSNGIVLNCDGSTWWSQDLGISDDLWDVWGTTANNVWLVGEHARLMQWAQGGPWADVPSGTDVSFYGVYVLSNGGTWLAGQNGTILLGPP